MVERPTTDERSTSSTHGGESSPVEEAAIAALPGPTRGARIATAVAVLASVAGVVGLLGGPLVTTTEFATLVAGSLEVRDEGSWRAVPAGDPVDDGAHLRAVGETVTLAVTGGRVVLAGGARADVVGGRLVIERGSVLVDAAGERVVTVHGVRVAGRGNWRVDAGVHPRLATYAGSLVADDGDTDVSIGAYHQVTVRDRSLGGVAAVPLRYLASDAFDRDEVSEALRIDDLAVALGRSLAGTYGQAPRPAAFYAGFVAVDGEVEPHLAELATVARGGRYGPPAEVLVAVTVVDAVAAIRGEPATDAAAHVASQRGRGAAWGLVLMAAGGDSAAFNAAAERALTEAADDPAVTGDLGAPADELAAAAAADRAPAEDDEGGAGGAVPGDGAGSPPGGGAGGSADRGSRDEPGASRGDPGRPAGDRPGRPDGPDEPGAPAPPTGEPLAPVQDGVRDLGRQLGGPLEDVTRAVGDVVGGLDELLVPPLRDLLGG